MTTFAFSNQVEECSTFPSRLPYTRAVESPHVRPHSNPMHLRAFWRLFAGAVTPLALALLFLASSVRADLARENVFALGGVGVAGTMSSGEKDLRAVLKEADAVQQLQSLLKNASPAGQLYALLGLRLRDRPAYEQAVPAFRKRSEGYIHHARMHHDEGEDGWHRPADRARGL